LEQLKKKTPERRGKRDGEGWERGEMVTMPSRVPGALVLVLDRREDRN